ncbi:gamma-glutamylaminecyclotransferase-like [Diretmus argenteus]
MKALTATLMFSVILFVIILIIALLASFPSAIHKNHIFVYGTLKMGQPNHYRMFRQVEGKAEFLSWARTVERYPLVIAGDYNIPFLLNIPGQGQRVRGEIYRVDERMLEYLDAFESVPTMYQRTRLKLEVEEWVGPTDGEETPLPGSVVEVFGYSTTTYKPDWPSLPTYESYDAYGFNVPEYVIRELRD